MVTGACGTVGSELVRQLLEDYNAAELIGLDNNESELFFLEQRFSECCDAHFFLADVRDSEKLTRKMLGIDVVFHTAAFKHVDMCERSPFEAVRTNVMGVQNIIQAAIDCNVKRVIFTSSDKAVNPTNVMGTSKLMGERLITAANSNQRTGEQVFTSTRFGNVIGSRGSVFLIFKNQIRQGKAVTLTDENMTRFIMSIREAVQLVIDSAALAMGGEVFITKMPVVKIKDLAEVMIEDLAPVYGHNPADIKIETIGVKPGEKMYEELMNEEEIRRSWELERYFSVLPAFSSPYRIIKYQYPEFKSDSVKKVYNSKNQAPLGKKELKEFLIGSKLLENEDLL